jgi:hypothetical protein
MIFKLKSNDQHDVERKQKTGGFSFTCIVMLR